VKALVVLLLAATAAADTLDVPKQTDEPHPLLVVLHGDRQLATTAVAKWKAAALARGYIVLSIQCPKSLGCDKASWWQWAAPKSTTYVDDQVAAVAKKYKVGPRYLVGWSGGASFIGRNVQWAATYDALVLHGGGIPPADSNCIATRAYFLVGDANPLHHLAVALRDYFTTCKQPVVWDLVAKGDHDKEDRALDRKKVATILDWLDSGSPRSK
jgi:poly(3-hydroxybutyrate) depolymerase